MIDDLEQQHLAAYYVLLEESVAGMYEENSGGSLAYISRIILSPHLEADGNLLLGVEEEAVQDRHA